MLEDTTATRILKLISPFPSVRQFGNESFLNELLESAYFASSQPARNLRTSTDAFGISSMR